MIVMKFGGTSVGNAARIEGVASLIISRLKEKPVVVVSAVTKVTDLLVQAGQEALHGESYQKTVEKIKTLHQEILSSLKIEIPEAESFYGKLLDTCAEIAQKKELSARSEDLIVSFGERFSCRILAEVIRKKGTPAKAFDAWDVGFVTTDDFTQAKLLPAAEKEVKRKITGLDVVPVITGFIGKTSIGEITTLGRGGSDLSASLIGAAIDAKAIEIWTDVPGIMTADPRLIPTARSLPSVTFQEAAELSVFGAKVLHPKTIEPAMKKNIPVLVKNTFEPTHPGTVILAEAKEASGIKAVTVKKKITSINIYSTGMLEAPGFLSRVFGILQNHGMSVDVVATSEVNISLTLDNTENLEAARKELALFSEISVQTDRAIVCLVGEELKFTPGIAGRVFGLLGKAGINIEMISQGASQINLTFVVGSADAKKAVEILHAEFFERGRKSM